MKRFTYIIPLLAMPLMLILMANKAGSAGGLTGSPGDNGTTCTSCHGGTVTSVNGWISTNIPESGYNFGEVYTITLAATDPVASRFGFEITAEDALKKKINAYNLTNTTETKLTNAGKAVTHTAAGVDPIGNSKTWSFEWTAPEESTGTVTFYAAVNAANGNNLNSGDIIYKTSASVFPASTRIEKIRNNFSVYPNPSSGLVNIELTNLSDKSEIIVLNSSGQEMVRHLPVANEVQLDLSNLPKGVYFIRLAEQKKSKMQKLILQ